MSREERIKRFWAITVTPEFERDHNDFLDTIVTTELESPTPEETMLRQMGAVMMFDTYERLPQVKASTLILQGDRDLLVVPGNADILHERMPDSRVVSITNAGHCFFWEQPEQSAKAVIEFLSAVPAPA
jgi:pimeloyl-ACP methyl ester carboxylesterase